VGDALDHEDAARRELAHRRIEASARARTHVVRLVAHEPRPDPGLLGAIRLRSALRCGSVRLLPAHPVARAQAAGGGDRAHEAGGDRRADARPALRRHRRDRLRRRLLLRLGQRLSTRGGIGVANLESGWASGRHALLEVCGESPGLTSVGREDELVLAGACPAGPAVDAAALAVLEPVGSEDLDDRSIELRVRRVDGEPRPRSGEHGGQEAPVASRVGQERHALQREPVHHALHLVLGAGVALAQPRQVQHDDIRALEQHVDSLLPETPADKQGPRLIRAIPVPDPHGLWPDAPQCTEPPARRFGRVSVERFAQAVLVVDQRLRDATGRLRSPPLPKRDGVGATQHLDVAELPPGAGQERPRAGRVLEEPEVGNPHGGPSDDVAPGTHQVQPARPVELARQAVVDRQVGVRPESRDRRLPAVGSEGGGARVVGGTLHGTTEPPAHAETRGQREEQGSDHPGDERGAVGSPLGPNRREATGEPRRDVRVGGGRQADGSGDSGEQPAEDRVQLVAALKAANGVVREAWPRGHPPTPRSRRPTHSGRVSADAPAAKRARR
jgi:hypothetical protein